MMKLTLGIKEFEVSLEGDDIPDAVVGTFQRLNTFLDSTPPPKRKKATAKKTADDTAEKPAATEAVTESTADPDPFAPPPAAEKPATDQKPPEATGGAPKTQAEFQKLIVAHHQKVGEGPIKAALAKYNAAKISDLKPEDYNNVLIELGLNDG